MTSGMDDPGTPPPQPPGAPSPEQGAAVSEPPPGEDPGEETRRLRRSRDDRVIAGVCGGLGEYLGVDPVLVRIAALILVFAGGAGIVLYLIGWIAMPEPPEAQPLPGAAPTPSRPAERKSGAVVLGLVFIVLGAFFLADEVWPDLLSWQYVWPVALIAVGAAILVRARR